MRKKRGMTDTTTHLTRALDERIRRGEIEAIRKSVETVQRLYPEAQATSIEIAGGIARFTGIDGLSQAFGVGTLAPVSANEIARLTDFYESRGSKPQVYVTPMADPSLATGMARAGYAPVSHESVLVSEDFDTCARYDDRVALATDLDAWAKASTLAFADGSSENVDPQIATILASSKGAYALEGRDGDAIAATGVLGLRGECAFLFASSTLAMFRRRGWHLALICDRIARARDLGARVMRATASPASTSEHNFHRCGFTTLYTRSLWERHSP
jgi:hypothetical protein